MTTLIVETYWHDGTLTPNGRYVSEQGKLGYHSQSSFRHRLWERAENRSIIWDGKVAKMDTYLGYQLVWLET